MTPSISIRHLLGLVVIGILCIHKAYATGGQDSIPPRDSVVVDLPKEIISADSVAVKDTKNAIEIIEQTKGLDGAVAKQGKAFDLKTIKKKQSRFVPKPKMALLWSIIPGGGQIYNRKYWKLPLIATAYTGFYYAITWNHANLTEYANAFRDIKSDAPLENRSWVDFIPSNAKPEDYINNTSFHEKLRRGRDFYRRNRDLSIIFSVATYILIMMDAYVDAELYSFDITPNVSLSYQPVISMPTTTTPQTSYGLQLALRF